jgi:hypothetical protein
MAEAVIAIGAFVTITVAVIAGYLANEWGIRVRVERGLRPQAVPPRSLSIQSLNDTAMGGDESMQPMRSSTAGIRQAGINLPDPVTELPGPVVQVIPVAIFA